MLFRSGIVYNDLGKPATEVWLWSRGKIYPEPVKTDNKGRFEIKGASVKDTFIVSSYIIKLTVINNGSRYLEINLPPANKPDITNGDLVILTKRKFPKKVVPEIQLKPVAGFDFIWQEEEHAMFPGGNYKFQALIKDNIVYPEKAIGNNIEGDVVIGFTIDKEGIPKDFKILRGIGYGCEEQVINAIKKSPKWIPGIFSGKAVATPSSITINFKLTDK